MTTLTLYIFKWIKRWFAPTSPAWDEEEWSTEFIDELQKYSNWQVEYRLRKVFERHGYKWHPDDHQAESEEEDNSDWP